MNMEQLTNVQESLKQIGKIVKSIEDLDLVIKNDKSAVGIVLATQLTILIDTYHQAKIQNKPFSIHFVIGFMSTYHQCITSGIIKEGNGVLSKFNELQEKYDALEKQDKEKDMIIKELEKDRDFYKQKKEAYEERYPTLRKLDTLEGDVDDD